MIARAVIGACFGDEGKGLMVDYFSSAKTLVVRHNGGAQAGHTVVTPGGRRHVFHHFGSGTLRGASTYLSRYFIANPFLWAKEVHRLGFIPRAYTHRDALLSTAYDMFVNQETQMNHGSCGIGIHETVVRCEGGYGTTCSDLFDLDALRGKVELIRSDWLPQRLSDCGLDGSIPDYVLSEHLLESFIADAGHMADCIEIVDDEVILRHDRVVFEGAQGLLLDQDHKFFPHVTHGKTGMTNPQAIADGIGISIEPVYVTRSYMTRHGDGPFPTEDESFLFADATNTHNEFQGMLRFGNMDVHLVAEAIRNDLEGSSGLLAMTHMDHINGLHLAEELAGLCDVKPSYFSTGPSRNHIRPMEKSRLCVEKLRKPL